MSLSLLALPPISDPLLSGTHTALDFGGAQHDWRSAAGQNIQKTRCRGYQLDFVFISVFLEIVALDDFDCDAKPTTENFTNARRFALIADAPLRNIALMLPCASAFSFADVKGLSYTRINEPIDVEAYRGGLIKFLHASPGPCSRDFGYLAY